MSASWFQSIFGRKDTVSLEIPDLEGTQNMSAFEIVDHLGKHISNGIRPGLPTRAIHTAVESFLTKKALNGYFLGYRGYPSVATVSVNEEVLGAPPSNRVIQEGDLVKVETGVRQNRQCASFGWTFPVGRVSSVREALLAAARHALDEGCKAVHIGGNTGDITRALDSAVRIAGFIPNNHFVGYRIGDTPHCSPQIPCSLEVKAPKVKLKIGHTYVILVIAHAGNHAIGVKQDGFTVFTRNQSDSVLMTRTITLTRHGPRVMSLWQGTLGGPQSAGYFQE